MRCAELVGRDREAGTLRAAVDRLTRGEGGVVTVVGEAGAGKSRLLAEVAAAARAAGLPVLAGRAVPAASPSPYRPLTEAVLAAFRSAPLPDDPSLGGFHAQLGRLAPAWATAGDAGTDESPVLLAEALLRLLVVHGRDAGGTVLVIEDAHWADPDTLAVLDYFVDALAAEPVLCVVSARPDGPALGLVERLVRAAAGAVIRVDALDPDAVDRMLAVCLSTADPPPVVRAFVHDHADGNPFLVEELLAGLVASGDLVMDGGRWTTRDRLTPSVPASLRDSIRRRLAALDPTARRVLGAAALLGRHFEWELLPGIAEVDGRGVVDGLRAAVDEQLIEVDGMGFTFRHALTREVVLAELLPPERRDLASRAWPAVELANPGLPGPTCELAADLAEAAGAPAAAAAHLVDSARRALAAGALATAEVTARRARQLAGDDADVLLDADEVLVHVLATAGKSGDALAVGRDLATRLSAAGAPVARQVDLLVTTARAGITSGDLAGARADVDAARALALAAGGDAAAGARIDVVAAHIALDSGDVVEAERLARSAREAATATGQPAVECDALLVLGRIERSTVGFDSMASFEEAARIAEDSRLGTWHLRARHEIALGALVTGDDGNTLRETRALAARYGALVTVAVMDLHIADVALGCYDADRCLEAATACVEASDRYGLATRSVAYLWLAGAYALTGDEKAMRAAIDSALADDADDPRILADLYGRVLTTRAFVSDELATLGSLCDTMMEHVRRAPPAQSVYPGRLIWAMLHAVHDDDHGAAALAEIDESVARMPLPLFPPAREAIAAVSAGRRGDADEAARRFDSVYEPLLHRALGRGLVHSLTILAATAAVRDGWGTPDRWLRHAEAYFGERGHDRLARRCRTMLAEAGAPMPRRGRGDSEVPASLRAFGVTSREVDVLKLVAAGRTNKDIAGELFLSPKTVERHLSSLFSRLGVANRRDLAAVAAGHLGDASP